jgi:UDPglucose--hexose-1-phosphate uridylyltransferase
MRPGAPRPAAEEEQDEATACPFCEGNEDRTPPESFAVASPGRTPNAPGWHVRVVPNLYPALSGALGRQEVVVHTPRHARSIAELSRSELEDVAAAWAARATEARRQGFGYVHAFVNEGRAAGASLAHSHSQLVWLPEPPPLATREWASPGRGRPCRLCEILEEERVSGSRIVLERDGLVLLCPYGSWAPYVLLLAPLRCEADGFESRQLPAALACLADAVRSLRSLEGPLPLNGWLHTSELGRSVGHWHLEVVPRLVVLAGLEHGTGLFVNPLPPEEAAAALRGAL